MSTRFPLPAVPSPAQESFRKALLYRVRDLEAFLKEHLALSPRCQALALTKLEECAMWATKGAFTDDA